MPKSMLNACESEPPSRRDPAEGAEGDGFCNGGARPSPRESATSDEAAGGPMPQIVSEADFFLETPTPPNPTPLHVERRADPTQVTNFAETAQRPPEGAPSHRGAGSQLSRASPTPPLEER